MTSPLVFRFSHLRKLKCPQFSTVATSVKDVITDPKKCQKKILKVAFVGRPNAGKSTLINKLLRLNLFGVSYKTHTTVHNAKAAYTKGDTQIVFLDTPGLVTQKERTRFRLPRNFLELRKNNYITDADIVGVVHEVSSIKDLHKLHLCLVQNIYDLPSTKPIFLVVNKRTLQENMNVSKSCAEITQFAIITNKLECPLRGDSGVQRVNGAVILTIDLILDRDVLAEAIDSLLPPEGSDRKSRAPKVWKKFSKVFFTSATKNIGIDKISEYLLQQAKPGDWIFESGQITDKPLNLIILELVRSHFLDILPHEIPYKCKYEIEYLKTNELGAIICVALVTCKYPKHKDLIISSRRKNIKEISKTIENDIYKVTGRVCKLRIVVT